MSKLASDAAPNILPVILAGGSGTRLWPLSRKHYAKQYLAFDDATIMLQAIAVFVGSGVASDEDLWLPEVPPVVLQFVKALARADDFVLRRSEAWNRCGPAKKNWPSLLLLNS